MILRLYIIILIYFAVGVIAFYFINRNKEKSIARKSWGKTIIYFIIIQIVFFTIIINPIVFRSLAVIIIMMGFYELFKLFRESVYSHKTVFVVSLVIFGVFAWGFYVFSNMGKEIIFFGFAIISIFDSFSQMTGQLWGRKKLYAKISPDKTIAGLIGGTFAAVLSVFLFKSLVSGQLFDALILASGASVFAFIGDTSCSFYKRKYNVKDFSNLIPEHGGFLDRFDSLVAGGVWFAMYYSIIS